MKYVVDKIDRLIDQLDAFLTRLFTKRGITRTQWLTGICVFGMGIAALSIVLSLSIHSAFLLWYFVISIVILGLLLVLIRRSSNE